MDVLGLARVPGLVRDLDDRVPVPRRNLPNRVQVRVEIHGDVACAGQCDDLDVKVVSGRRFEQTRQRGNTVLRRQVHEPLSHCEHANHRQALVLGPGEIPFDVGVLSTGHVLEQPKGRDATPLECMMVGRHEPGRNDVKVVRRVGSRTSIAAGAGGRGHHQRHGDRLRGGAHPAMVGRRRSASSPGACRRSGCHTATIADFRTSR